MNIQQVLSPGASTFIDEYAQIVFHRGGGNLRIQGAVFKQWSNHLYAVQDVWRGKS